MKPYGADFSWCDCCLMKGQGITSRMGRKRASNNDKKERRSSKRKARLFAKMVCSETE